MDFVKWLGSLDDLLFELMSWLVFYPVTLWRLVRRPLATLRYAEAQLTLAPEAQFRDSLSPPITLVLTLALTEAIDRIVSGANPIVASRHGLAGLINDDTSLLLLRLVAFGLFPLILATRKVVKSGVELDRDSLEPAFYAQCYAVAPFALLLATGTTLATAGDGWARIAGHGLQCAGLAYYLLVEMRWFRAELDQSLARSVFDAVFGLLAGTALTLGLALALQA